MNCRDELVKGPIFSPFNPWYAGTHGCGKGLLLRMSIFKLWMLLDSWATLATTCSTDLSSSSSKPNVAIVNLRRVSAY
jgi:hypothetical protein